VYLVTLSVVWRMPRHSFFLNRSASGTKKHLQAIAISEDAACIGFI